MNQNRAFIFSGVFVGVFSGALLGGISNSQAQFDIERLSVTSGGVQVTGASTEPTISDNGNLVAFTSQASNLIGGDVNGVTDIFLKNRTSKALTLISSTTDGVIGNGASQSPSISGDGTVVVYSSDSGNLVGDDSNGLRDIFAKVIGSGVNERVSVDSNETQANGASSEPSVSDNGRYVVFSSLASNLVNDDTNGVSDIFLRDRTAGTTIRVSRTSGQQGDGASISPVISGDGAFVAFVTAATNLIGSDTNGKQDIYRYEVATGDLELVSVTDSNVQAVEDSLTPSISDDGRYVTFSSAAGIFSLSDSNGLPDIFRRDLQSDTTTILSIRANNTPGNGSSLRGRISGNGAEVIFLSDAANLVDGDANNTAGDGIQDLFRKTVGSGALVRRNLALGGVQVVGNISSADTTDTGAAAVFASGASTFVAGDTNGVSDIFIVDEGCTLDTDGDTTPDCSDSCSLDPAKTAPGVCGCGSTETDTDSDGTFDCNDGCPADPLKIEVGACGCGVSDIDANGNGVADCSDPTTSTRPFKPVSSVRGRRVSSRIAVEQFVQVVYEFELRRGSRVLQRRSSRSGSVRFAAVPQGRYTVRYRIRAGTTRTRYSPNSIANVR